MSAVVTAPDNRFVPLRRDDRSVVVLDSATHAHRHAATTDAAPGTEVIVNASYAGVYCARLLQDAGPLATIGLDCGIGKDGAAIAGLWFFDALKVPAAAVDIAGVEHGNGADLWEHGVISRVNAYAEAAGVRPGHTVAEAAEVLLAANFEGMSLDPTDRVTVFDGPAGHDVVCTNSIADALPEDRDRNVLCTAGHTGRSVVDYILGARPYGFICSDGAFGKNDSGVAALRPANDAGIPGASVSALTARMGDGRSTYFDGVISAANDLAMAAGVRIGQRATEAAQLLATRAVAP
jgi:hypothetical protein